MHIAVFSQYHTSPDCPATSRHYSLLRELTAAGHRVTLFTTDAWRGQQLTHEFPWLPEGVEAQVADIAYHNRMNVPARGLAFVRYAAWAARAGTRLTPRPDVIWGISTPLTAAWTAARVARRLGVPWVFEVQDLWPSFPIAMGAVPGGWLQRRLFGLEKSLYQSAAHILPLSPDMSAYVAARGISPAKITTSLNGTDLDLAARATPAAVEALRQELGLRAGQRVVLYAGTFGRANDIPTLVAAAEALYRQQPDVVWLFLGHGFYAPLLEAAAARCPAIRLVAPQPRHAVFTWFSLADVSIVSFLPLPVLDANSPAKFYDSLSVGTPVIVTNQGWTKSFVEQHGCGWYAPAANPAALVATLTEILHQPARLHAAGEQGRAIAARLFDRRQLAHTIEEILHRAASKGLGTGF